METKAWPGADAPASAPHPHAYSSDAGAKNHAHLCRESRDGHGCEFRALGAAAALTFAREGAKVVVAARREDKSQAAVRQIKAVGGEGAFIKTDVTKRAEIEALVEGTVATFGRLDCAVNNAGITGPVMVPRWPRWYRTLWTVLTEPGEVSMRLTQAFGLPFEEPAEWSPEGVRGLNIVKEPPDPTALEVDREVFRWGVSRFDIGALSSLCSCVRWRCLAVGGCQVNARSDRHSPR